MITSGFKYMKVGGSRSGTMMVKYMYIFLIERAGWQSSPPISELILLFIGTRLGHLPPPANLPPELSLLEENTNTIKGGEFEPAAIKLGVTMLVDQQFWHP